MDKQGFYTLGETIVALLLLAVTLMIFTCLDR